MKTWGQLQTSQPIIVKMLTNSLRKDRISHAYLFEGGRGTGKKEAATLLAKSIFCKKSQLLEPCQECIECRRIDSRNHPDLHVISPDGLSLKKEQIVNLQKEFSKTGVESNRKVYIVEHVDKMTVQAANSLLKFLEEPSSQTVAILLTENIHQILPTIISRCQILSFTALTPDHMIHILTEKGVPNYLSYLVASLTNNLEEALTIIEDDWFAQARNIVIQLSEVIHEKPDHAFLMIHENWMNHFKEKEQLDRGLELLLLWFKDLLYIKVGEEQKVVYTDQIDRFKKYILYSPDQKILAQILTILEAKKRLNANMNPQALMEQLVLKLQEG